MSPSRNIAALGPNDEELFVADICPAEVKEFNYDSHKFLCDGVEHCERPEYDAEDGLRILLCFPSKKLLKNKPLSDWIKDQIHETFGSKEVKIIYDLFTYSVEDTGVGEQPLHTHGFHGGKEGAYQRIIQGLKDVHPIASNYHAVFFMALESDIDVRAQPLYDKANFLLYEYYSGLVRGVMSRGPSVQTDLFHQVDIDKDVTYGKVLQKVFGVPHDDWHSVVCYDQEKLNSRTAFIQDALDHLMIHDDLKKLFSFCL